MEEAHSNVIKPDKQKNHTIIQEFFTKDDKAVGQFGVKGGFLQPHDHLQIFGNMSVFLLNPQAALDAPS